MKFKGLVLAAGMSKRMGEFKPLMNIAGKTLIEYSLHSLINSNIEDIVLVVGYRGNEIEKLIANQKKLREKITIVYNENYKCTEMLDSVKLGLKQIGKCDGFFLLPGDMPAVSQSTFKQLKNKFVNGSIVFPTIENHRKHPPLISNIYIKEILNYESENGLRGFWEKYNQNIIEVSVKDNGCMMDTDTKDQFDEICKYIENINNLSILKKT